MTLKINSPVTMKRIGHISIHIATTTTNTVVIVSLTVVGAKVNRWLQLKMFSVSLSQPIENRIQTTTDLSRILASTFVNINFSTSWPPTISWFVLWHHPYCRPYSSSVWLLCPYFNSSISLKVRYTGCSPEVGNKFYLMIFWCDLSRSIISMLIFFS